MYRDVFCTVKHRGLAVKRLDIPNRVLLSKWGQRFMERGVLLHKVIFSKYKAEEGGWQTLEVDGSYGVRVWQAIKLDWACKVLFDVGNGRRFWF